MKRPLLIVAFIATGSVATVSGQLMDLSCMEATRKKANEMLEAFRSEGVTVRDGVFGEVSTWSQRVEREGKDMETRRVARLEALDTRINADSSVVAAADRLRQESLSTVAPWQTRAFQEAREAWRTQQQEARERAFFQDQDGLEIVKASLDQQGRWNREEIGHKDRLYSAQVPAAVIDKHEQAAVRSFSAQFGSVPPGAAARQTIGVLAAIKQVGDRMQLGDHEGVLSAQGRSGFDSGLEPIEVLLRSTDLNELHGDMAVRHVQQAALPPAIRRQAVSQLSGPAGEVMRSAMREAAIGVHQLGKAQIGRQELRTFMRDVPPPDRTPASSQTEAEGDSWASKVITNLREKAAEVTEKPVWKVIVVK
jgi:hypothetical protein